MSLVLDNDNLLRKSVFTFAHDTPTPFINRSHITRSNSNHTTIVALFFLPSRVVVNKDSTSASGNSFSQQPTVSFYVGRVERDETRSWGMQNILINNVNIRVVISSTNEEENEGETREKRKRNLMNLNFKHRNLDLARSRSTIINEECLGKYDAVTFDPKTKVQVDV